MTSIKNARKADSPEKPRSVRQKGDVCFICKGATIFGEADCQDPPVLCTDCNTAFHKSCAGISDSHFYFYIHQKKKPWHCYLCDIEMRNKTQANHDSIGKIEAVVQNVNLQIQTLAMELQKIQSQMCSSISEIEYRLCDKIEDIIEKKFAEKMDEVIDSAISEKISHLRAPAATSSHPTSTSSYRKNIVITCVPELANENVLTIVKKIAKQINFHQDGYIDNCFRIEKKTNDSPKPSTVLVKCTTELSRDSFLRCYFNYIKTNRLTPADIGLVGDDRIYVNEHMIPTLQPVLKKALAMKRDSRIIQIASHSMYLSIKYNRLDRPTWTRVYNEEDLSNLLID